MALEEHISQLKKGVESWNAWRKDYRSRDLGRPELGRSDLEGLDLSGANLTGAFLGAANLRRTNLAGADLGGANLISAGLEDSDLSNARLPYTNLTDANLSRANLTKANFTGGSNLTGTDLSGADLHGAVLLDTNLTRARLDGADLTGAHLARTVLVNVNLTKVVGLETCIHHGPSFIDFRTLQLSKSPPLPFLRGVGLPDLLIEYLPAVFNRATQYHSCFISYSAKDQGFVDRIYGDLQNTGVRCWLAPHDMPVGGKILDEIDSAIRLWDKVLLILSEHSIKSGWVEDEVTIAYEEERKRDTTVLFPIRLDDTVMTADEPWVSKLRVQRNIGDFRRWKDLEAYKNSLKRIVRDLTIPPTGRS